MSLGLNRVQKKPLKAPIVASFVAATQAFEGATFVATATTGAFEGATFVATTGAKPSIYIYVATKVAPSKAFVAATKEATIGAQF